MFFNKKEPLPPEYEGLSASVIEELEEGSMIFPDAENPEHAALLALVHEMEVECGRKVKLFLSPVVGADEEERHESKLETMSSFAALPGHDEVFMPECALEFFTPDEVKAVLAHEFNHLERPDLSHTKAVRAHEYVLTAVGELLAKKVRLPGKLTDKLERNTDKVWERLSEIATELEVTADEAAIDKGRASDLVGALQKMVLTELYCAENELGEARSFIRESGLLEQLGLRMAPEVLYWPDMGPEDVNKAHESFTAPSKDRENRDADPHTAESFAERLARLEKAAENEPERPSRGR